MGILILKKACSGGIVKVLAVITIIKDYSDYNDKCK